MKDNCISAIKKLNTCDNHPFKLPHSIILNPLAFRLYLFSILFHRLNLARNRIADIMTLSAKDHYRNTLAKGGINKAFIDISVGDKNKKVGVDGIGVHRHG